MGGIACLQCYQGAQRAQQHRCAVGRALRQRQRSAQILTLGRIGAEQPRSQGEQADATTRTAGRIAAQPSQPAIFQRGQIRARQPRQRAGLQRLQQRLRRGGLGIEFDQPIPPPSETNLAQQGLCGGGDQLRQFGIQRQQRHQAGAGRRCRIKAGQPTLPVALLQFIGNDAERIHPVRQAPRGRRTICCHPDRGNKRHKMPAGLPRHARRGHLHRQRRRPARRRAWHRP